MKGLSDFRAVRRSYWVKNRASLTVRRVLRFCGLPSTSGPVWSRDRFTAPSRGHLASFATWAEIIRTWWWRESRSPMRFHADSIAR